MKIAIIGYSGSGKSTLAKMLHEHYQIPLLYLDTVQFKENWQQRDLAEAQDLVREFMKNDSWVMDGNYTAFFKEERLRQADKIIFLNFSRFNCLYRAIKRNIRYHNKTRESIADGCNEKMDREFIWWILRDGRTKAKKKGYQAIIQEYRDKVTIIRNQKELDEFKRTLLKKGYPSLQESHK